jgi:hypothetical protein
MTPPRPPFVATARLALTLTAAALAGCLEDAEDPRPPAPRPAGDRDGGQFVPGPRPVPPVNGGSGSGSGSGSGAATPAPADADVSPLDAAPDAESPDAGVNP